MEIEAPQPSVAKAPMHSGAQLHLNHAVPSQVLSVGPGLRTNARGGRESRGVGGLNDTRQPDGGRARPASASPRRCPKAGPLIMGRDSYHCQLEPLGRRAASEHDRPRRPLRQDRGAGNDCPSWSRSPRTAREGAQRAAGASERDARTRAADDPAAARALRAIEPLVLRRRLQGSRGVRVRARGARRRTKRAAAPWAAAGPGRQNAKLFVCSYPR
jgi:hypothetical protein